MQDLRRHWQVDRDAHSRKMKSASWAGICFMAFPDNQSAAAEWYCRCTPKGFRGCANQIIGECQMRTVIITAAALAALTLGVAAHAQEDPEMRQGFDML